MRSDDEPTIDEFKFLDLNQRKDIGGDSYPVKGDDVYAQRLSVYIQRNMENVGFDEDWRDDPSSYTNIEPEGVPEDSPEGQRRDVADIRRKIDNSTFKGPN